MSEDFDKEAERERLREKYEKDKKKREATEQMSELLLQGATMTNAHCSTCSDPIFRYDGQEFCPTCEKPVDRGESSEDANEDGESTDGDGDQIEMTTPSEDARVSFGKGAAEQADTAAESDEPVPEESQTPEIDQRTGETATQPTDGAEPQPQPRSARQPRQDSTRQPEPQQGQSPPLSASPQTEEASVETAREALVQTLTRFSQHAAATDDPARAQEYLAAALEAAEALDALRQ